MKKRGIVLLTLLIVAVSTYAQRADLSGIRICIDPGHGGNNPANDRYVVPDPGTAFWESESNFQKALWLDTLLRARGATVLLTRTTNSYPNDGDEPSLSARVAFANSNNASWFHSIHSNAFNGATNYTLMLVREKIVPGGDPVYGPGMGVPERQEAWDMAVIIGGKIRDNIRSGQNYTRLDWTFYGGSNGGYTLGVLRGLLMPGELSEGSFHDYFPETRRLMNNSYRKMEAYALRNSFMQYYAVPADTMGIIAGVQSEYGTQKNINLSRVRILPLNRTYVGDSYNNGFYMFDNLPPATYTVRFETPGYPVDSVVVSVGPGSLHFRDRSLLSFAYPTVLATSPVNNDPAFDPSKPITVNFSKPMDIASVQSAFSITPAVPGAFVWSGGNSVLTFDPDSILPFYATFTVRIDTTARSIDGKALDASGDGAPDLFSMRFTTKYVDAVPPQLVHLFPGPAVVLATTNHVVNMTFGEPLKTSTITLSNIVAGEIAGSILPRTFEYFETGNKGAVVMYLPDGLKEGKNYRFRISGVSDLAGNVILPSAQIYWELSVRPEAYQYLSLDSVGPSSTAFKAPEAVGGSATMTMVSAPKLGGAAPNSGAARLDYTWDTTAGTSAIRVTVDSTSVVAQIAWVAAGHVLQMFFYGDGSGNEVQLVVRDSLANGTTRRVLGPRYSISWVGWRMLEWDFERDTLAPGEGPLTGRLCFDGFVLRRIPGMGRPSGQVGFDHILLAKKVIAGVDEQPSLIPTAYALEQNYPNPFNPTTVFSFQLPVVSNVQLGVYDILGREVEILVNERKEPGIHSVTWNASRMSSGVYIVRLDASEGGGGTAFTQARKVVLAK